MELWVKGPDGAVIAVYRDGKLNMHRPLSSDGVRLVAFELFSLMTQMMTAGSGPSYGTFQSGDSDFGSPAAP